ncbi:hypothetical protein, variant [Aphanomyces astaci]|uniref:Sec16 Sec23-binding domain-containing protein n=1 Tax=Aphanomyces astaci TaxID=112090 RepID=W4H1Q7_APHAT|nr:hypothetical protein, variant [Aphanomyces astaci]ETV85073.1 hypothetical protein, variant [Aphanomyces astaci]|eukprot:XP_009825091.1 hypothetical protein, variant [Aphanomyces astaci]
MDPRANAATAWSPVKDLGNLFALGTTSSELHLVSLDFSAVDAAPHVVGLVPTPAPFRTLAWSPATKHAAAHPWGLVAGGLEDGTVSIWDPTQISTGHIDALSTVSKHKGAVTALQFNPNKDSTHLLASGGADGDVWIMSVNNVAAPGVFSPGTALASTSAPSEITCVSWNTTAPYILATGDSSGHVTVWDLKQKKPCFNVSVYGAISSLAWSPHEGFLLLTATRQSPLVHIWDLRASNSVPLVELHGHHGGGIVSAAWCPHGSGLLVTSGTDGRTLVWDLQTRQVIHEVPTSEPAAHLTFSPQYPGLVAFTTVNEHAVHVLQATAGATYPILKWTPPIIPSPVADDTTTEPPALQLSPELSSFSSTEVVPSRSKSSVELPVLHDDVAAAATSVAASPARSMHPLPVTSSSASSSSPEPVDALVFAVHQLDELTPDAFCDWKLTTLTDIDDDQARHTWSFLKVLFEPDARKQLLVHLGFDGAADLPSAILPSPSDVESGPLPTFTAASEASITRSLLVGNFDAAVDVCLANNQLANALLLATCGGPELWHRTQEAFFSRQTRPFMQIVAAIIKNELDTLVLQSDPFEWKQTLAILSTYSKSDEFPALCDQLAWRLLKSGDAFAASLCFICAMNMPKTVELWTAAASSHGHVAATVHLVEQIHVLAQGTGQAPDLDAPVYEAFAALLHSWDQPVLARKFSKHDTTTGTRGGSTSITTSSSSTAKKDVTIASFRSSPPKPIKLAPVRLVLLLTT